MKGLLRIYDDGETFKCKLNWAVIKDNYLSFFDDKKNQNPNSFINLSGCRVKKIFNETYNVNMIEITTSNNHMFLITPDNMKDFDKWKDLLHQSSQNFRDSYGGQQPAVTPRTSRTIVDNSSTGTRRESSNSHMRLQNQNNTPNQRSDRDQIVVDHRGRNLENAPGPSNRRSSGQVPQRPNRDRKDSSDSYVKGNYAQLQTRNSRKPSTDYYDKRESNVSGYRRSRAIETVKEDPMMSDEEIFETKPLEELRRKYPITDKTKRWSIAATDLVGKSNDELFLMLIQLNREKSHMEIWKVTLEKYIEEIDETLKERLSMQAVNELEGNRAHYVEQLNNIEYLMNLAHPLISFMDAVVQMSDAYGGNNEAFHVAYHQCTPTGKEDFSNINFIRHNQEKQVAKLINENKNVTPSVNSQALNSLSLDNGSDKENDVALLLNLNNTEDFINRKSGLNEIIEEISSQLQELEPTKTDIENFIRHIDDDSDLLGIPVINSKGSIKSVRSLKDNETKANNSAFMPRRSTRKAPKTDMGPSIQRKETLKSTGSLGTRSQNASLRYDNKDSLGINLNVARHSFHSNTAVNNNGYTDPVRVKPLSVTPKSQKSRTPPSTNLSDSLARSSSSRVQNQLRDLLRTEPYEEKRPPSPIYRAPSSILGVPDIQSGPLIKLNANLFQNPHGPKRSTSNEFPVDPPMSRISMSESDVSVSSHRINQRLNLNQFVDDNKNWKNPGRDVHSPGISGNYIMNNDDSDADREADRLIQNLLSTPAKVNIGERYRASITDDDATNDIDGQRSRKMRQLVANESFSRMTKEDAGQQNQRESMLLNNSRLAQEASRKSRNLQKI